MHLKIYYFICLLLLKLTHGCVISLNNDLGNPQPLLLRPSYKASSYPFQLPTNRDRIHFNDDDVLIVTCPGSHLKIKNKVDYCLSSYCPSNYCPSKTVKKTFEKVKCKNEKFIINEKQTAFQDITCNKMPEHVAKLTNKKCLGKYQDVEVGFVVKNNFLKTMDICFDNTTDRAIYVKHNLTRTIAGFQFGFPRPSWIQDRFFNAPNVNLLYTRNTQRRTINNLLGLDPGSFKYVSEFDDFFLARGHLAPRGDFLYASLQWSTFYFINASPQWQTFNGANWMYLESDIRRFASRNDLDFIIYTGTYGVLTLPHEKTKEEIELFLDVDRHGNNHRIPVPKLYWKVVYEPIYKSGVVFLGVNNPYLKIENIDDYVICEDVCEEIDWLTWERENITAGVAYCCEVEEFRRKFNGLPEFEVLHLLK